MRKWSFLALCFALVVSVSSTAMAATITERVDFAHQRIEHGIRSGALTREEAHRLREEFFRIRRDEDRARADGHLDHRERERLNAELDRLERHISYLKHNDERRGSSWDGRRRY